MILVRWTTECPTQERTPWELVGTIQEHKRRVPVQVYLQGMAQAWAMGRILVSVSVLALALAWVSVSAQELELERQQETSKERKQEQQEPRMERKQAQTLAHRQANPQGLVLVQDQTPSRD